MNPDAQEAGGLAGNLTQENPDILVLSGEDMPKTMTSSVSTKIRSFIAIDDNCFLLYDENDHMLKLVGIPQ